MLTPTDRRREDGQAVVEFAIIAPAFLVILFGIIAGCYLAFESSSLHDGASAGARAASIETSLTGSGGCESSSPQSIEKAVAQAAPSLRVNAQQLCSNGSPTTLTQAITVPGDVNITVTCGNTCAAPTSVSVALTYSAVGFGIPFVGTYTMHASSEVAILAP